MPNAAYMSHPSGSRHQAEVTQPKFRLFDLVGAYQVVEYLGHMVPDFTEGYTREHCYTIACRVCGDRTKVTQKMINERLRKSQKLLKAGHPPATQGCRVCKGVAPCTST